MTVEVVANEIVLFLRERLGPTAAGLDSRTDLIASALVDSMLIVELIGVCEERFGVALEADDLTEDAVRTPVAFAQTVVSRASA